jgi:aminotransferase
MFHQPCYVSYHPSITLVHGQGIAVPTYAKDGFALTAEALRAAWQPGAKILMLNLPCNPTGGTCTASSWRRSPRSAARRTCWC